MLYVTRNNGAISVYDSDRKVYRVGDHLPDGSEVVSVGVTDWFMEQFWNLVGDELYDFESEHDIDVDPGDVPYDVAMQDAVDAMVVAIAKAKAWRLANLTEVEQ